MTDPQLEVYRRCSGTGRYAEIARLIDLCMWIDSRPCKVLDDPMNDRDHERCDEGERRCWRHLRAQEIAQRIYRMRDRRAKA